MKRVTFVCENSDVIRLLTGLLPHIKSVIVDDVAPAPIRLESPPAAELEALRRRPGRPRKKPKLLQASGETEQLLNGRALANILMEEFTYAEGPVGTAKLKALAKQFLLPMKTVRNAVHGLRARGKIIVVGGDKVSGYEYRLRPPSETPA